LTERTLRPELGGFRVGLDIVEVSRISRLAEEWGDKFMRRLFTEAEIAFCEQLKNKHQSYAARFSAKEALLKAIGTGLSHGARWKDMEVVDDGRSSPRFSLSGVVGELVGKREVSLSISHTEEYAAAVVVLRQRIL
jgi:holo-[acyl-carrier protein] synthase